MTPIYHITHVDNLPGIVREGGLVCDQESVRRGLCSQSIAYAAIKQRRQERRVESVLADYVPFYFTQRSPMLLAIHKGQVQDYQGGQSDVVYLVSSVETVAASGVRWCFTDGHAVERVTEFFDRIEDLARVDWRAVATWKWGGRWLLNDPDIKRRKQAEFLVHGRFPLHLVNEIAVIDRSMTSRVAPLLAGSQTPRVTVQPGWYHNV
jgi:hypothetical protein